MLGLSSACRSLFCQSDSFYQRIPWIQRQSSDCIKIFTQFVSRPLARCGDRPCGIVLRSERSTHGPRQKTERWTDGRSDGQRSELWFGALAVASVEDWTYVSAHVRFKGTGKTDNLFLARCQVYNYAVRLTQPSDNQPTYFGNWVPTINIYKNR